MTNNSEKSDDKLLSDELLSAYVDGELTGEELAQVERRLADDPQSRQLVEELRLMSVEVQSLPRQTVGEDLRATVMQRAERAMLLGTEERQALRPSESGSSRRWMWPAMAVAASLLLAVFLPKNPEEEKPLASAKPVPVESPQVVPQLEAVEEEQEAAAIEREEGMAVLGGGVGGAMIDSASETVASGVVRERASMSAPVVAADGLIAEAKEVAPELQVVLTLNEGTSNFESFNQLLLSNGIAVQKNFSGPKAEASGIASHASKRALSKEQNDDQPSAEEKVLLVEATPEQIENVLEACNADTRNLASVELQAENKATNQLHTQWQQWQRTGKQLAQSKLRYLNSGLKRKKQAIQQSLPAGIAMRLETNQYQAQSNGLLDFDRNLLSKKAKQTAAQSPIQVLFILKQNR